MSIQAIKGVEIGDGFGTARRRGSRRTTRSAGQATGVRGRPTGPAGSRAG